MAMPSSLRCEQEKLRKQDPGTPVWWGTRVAITVGFLQMPFKAMFRHGGPWALLGPVAALAAAGLLWWMAARLYEAERKRIERKQSSGKFGGWRSAIPIILLTAPMVLMLRPFRLGESEVITMILFVGMIFVMEQSLAAKRTSFDLLVAREDALRAKLAPHFIFNTLNTLHAQIEHDPRGAQLTTERLAEVFRQVIATSDQPTIPLKQELAFVEAYLGIEQARLGERLRVEVVVPEDLESAPIPPLSLQVLVENAVKHGVAPLERGGTVRIGAERVDSALRVWVEDPGSGNSPAKGTGTALQTLRQRLERPGDLEMGMAGGRHRVSFRWRLS